MKIAKDVTELIGKTPLVDISDFAAEYGSKANIAAKLEYFNPLGSVKDRAALGMINDAEKRGLLKKGSVIVEPTSGNTGVGLAYISAIRGYRLMLTMPDTMSIERRKLLGALGAEVILTPGEKGMAGAIEKANELVEKYNAFMPQQFENKANANAHVISTAPEILSDTDGKVDAFVATFGSGGTVTGVGMALKEALPNVKVIAVEPAESPLLSKGTAAPHKIQGIGANFIPNLLNVNIIDEVVTVSGDEAYEATRKLAKNHGILCGISSGAAAVAAAKIGARPEYEGKLIVTIFPDTGERYLSCDLF